ncbi:MAG: phage tail protein, partial [Oscillospiraceae bacterium]|nr:phage tail protein [Oscillospiraceae bacterium]
MATATATAADFAMFSFYVVSGGRITEGPETMETTIVFNIDGVPSGATVQSAAVTATLTTNNEPRTLRINTTNVSRGTQTVALTPTSTGNGAYSVDFRYQCQGNPELSDGQHVERLDVTALVVTVTYQAAPTPPPEPEPSIDWDGVKPISVFAPDASSFGNNGLAVLMPIDGRLRMVAGGACEITMRHPIDDTGKWKFLVTGALVRVPVPAETIENAFIGADVDLYRTNQSAALREGPSEPSTITYEAWVAGTSYAVGKRVTYSRQNYELTDTLTGMEIYSTPPTLNKWKKIANQTSGSPVLVQLPSGSDLYYISASGSSWYKMSTPMGIEGYIKTSQVTFIRHLTPEESDERIITDQLFRIKNVTIDTEKMELNLYAEHVSYDLAAILIRDVKMSQASPALAINRVIEGLMMPYRGQIATNLTTTDNGTYTGAFNGKNGIFAFLDPDSGIVPTFDARFSRDNWDLFILQKTNTDRGFWLRYGTNVRGISWKRNIESLVTRVVPVAKDQDGNDLYLPEQYIDSPHINEHPVVYMQRLAVKGQIGKDDGTGTGTTWTAEALYEEIRTKAQERFSVDHADVIYA